MNDDEKACPRCAETIKKAALVCRFCGHEFGEAAAPPKRPTPSSRPEPSKWLPAGARAKAPEPIGKPADEASKRNTLLGCIGLVFVLGLIGQCVGSSGDDNASASGSVELASAVANSTTNAWIEPDVQRSNWSTSSYRDELRGGMVNNASIVSENEVEFDFPYSGGSNLTMTVRKHPKYGEDVIFQISDGQFICGVYDCQGAINFDGKAETLSLGPPEDHDSKTLFSKYPNGIIKKLKASKRVVVELTFYQEGNRQFTFETAGLVWPPRSE